MKMDKLKEALSQARGKVAPQKLERIKEMVASKKAKAPGMKAKEAARKGQTRVGAARAGAKKY
jgi:hypothetical protein